MKPVKTLGDQLPEELRASPDLDRELLSVLQRVPDEYADFLVGVMCDIRKYPDRRGGLISWIKAHPEATTSDVLEFMQDELIPEILEQTEDDLDPDWFEGYTDEELQRDYGYRNKAEAAADTPGTPEYEARMREEAAADDRDDADEGLTEME